ncbi:MAG TPA: glycosyltransferase, partial [Methanoregulaceae archaeon]|nr:glycosyltransferase [Methanoregulaceae archaeon]
MPEYSESETVTLTRQDQGEIPYSGNSEKMTDHPLVTVVVVNYNGRHFLRECLASITDQTYAPLEVIFVDNASSDGSVEYVRALFPGIHILQNNENRGFSGGVNSGIRESNGRYIITLNNDNRMDSHCIRHLVHAMSGDA